MTMMSTLSCLHHPRATHRRNHARNQHDRVLRIQPTRLRLLADLELAPVRVELPDLGDAVAQAGEFELDLGWVA